jgi:hypothetical protein
LYVTATEYQEIAAQAADLDVTISFYLRALLHQYTPLELPPRPARGAPPGNRNARAKPADRRLGQQ